MNVTANPPNDDIPKEIDFASGVHGKFYQADLRINLPVYLDAEVQAYLTAIATKEGVPLSDIANDLSQCNG